MKIHQAVALAAILLPLLGCVSAPPPMVVQPVDDSVMQRIRAHEQTNPNQPKMAVAEVDRSSIDRTQYSHCKAALLKCGYTKAEAEATALEYLTNISVWNAELEKLRYGGAAPLHLYPEIATWETVRSRCGSAAKSLLEFPGASAQLKARSQTRPQDRVIVNNLLASAALHAGRFQDAKTLLDDSLLCLGGISAGDKSARQARNVFYQEDKKNFRGEPFERVMTYYYRGILYWRDGELENARACFRSAQIEDGDAEKSEYRSDYVLLDYLDGLITTKLGGDGQYCFRQALSASQTNNVHLRAPPPYDAQANVQLFVEFGRSPVKQAAGNYSHLLKIQPSPVGPTAAIITLPNQVIQLTPYDDVAYQATTRGGRVMDHINKNKAVFKDTTGDVGEALIAAGAATAAGGDDAGVAGLAIAGVGLLVKGISHLANPACDTRTWWNLPQFLGFASFSMPPGSYAARVQFVDRIGKPLPHLDKHISFTVTDAKSDTVIFVSDKNI